jgi:hypothetical protein
MTLMSPQIESFSLQLQQRQADFICTTALPGSAAAVAFLGTFQGQTVLWQMTLATLQYYRQSHKVPGVTGDSSVFGKPFIEILPGQQGCHALYVGLDLGIIDEAVIKKSIIMIRNYKRLAAGKMEFSAVKT